MSMLGKVALITGASGGIGKAGALALAKEGATIIVNGRPGNEKLNETVKLIRELGAKCYSVEADIFNSEGRKYLIENAIELAGKVDIFVNVPALNLRNPFLELALEDFEQVVASILSSGFHMSQLVARNMVDEGCHGRIIFISSVLAKMPIVNNVAYGAAKAGLNQMARAISVELAKHQITVNTIEPGWIDTPGERVWTSDSEMKEEGRKLPLGRLGAAEDIANSIAFLASDASSYITGATLTVDGAYRYKDCGG